MILYEAGLLGHVTPAERKGGAKNGIVDMTAFPVVSLCNDASSVFASFFPFSVVFISFTLGIRGRLFYSYPQNCTLCRTYAVLISMSAISSEHTNLTLIP